MSRSPGCKQQEERSKERHEEPAVQIDIDIGKSRARTGRQDSRGEQQHARDCEEPTDGKT
jgi:hypothetical protein